MPEPTEREWLEGGTEREWLEGLGHDKPEPTPYTAGVAAAVASLSGDADEAADAFLRQRLPGPATHAGRIAAAGVPVTPEDFDVRRDG